MSTLLEARGLDVTVAGKRVYRRLALRIATGERWAIPRPQR